MSIEIDTYKSTTGKLTCDGCSNPIKIGEERRRITVTNRFYDCGNRECEVSNHAFFHPKCYNKVIKDAQKKFKDKRRYRPIRNT